MMSFRVYPPDYNPPLNQTPDGTIVSDDRSRVEKWGKCFGSFIFIIPYYINICLLFVNFYHIASLFDGNFLYFTTINFVSSYNIFYHQTSSVSFHLDDLTISDFYWTCSDIFLCTIYTFYFIILFLVLVISFHFILLCF